MENKMKTLFVNAVIHTMESEGETAGSMLVEDGYIKQLNVKSAKGVRTVDLRGQHVYPCMIDGHAHLLSTVVLAGSSFEICSIENGAVTPDSMAGVEKRLRAFAVGKGKSALIVANNYILSAIGRLPTRWELDEWSGMRPVIIYTIDGHASALSSKMLRKLGIEDESHDGILMGEAHERVQGRLTDIIAASVTPAVLARGCAEFQNTCAGFGLSTVCGLEGNGDSKRDITTKLIVLLARHFNVDVRFYFQYMDIDKALPLTRFQRRARIGGCGDWEMDGALGAHTAAFSLPYRDTGKTAPCYYEQSFVDEKVLEADRRGFQIACHAIGDLAIERIVEALSKTSGKIRHRIEHCEFASDRAIDTIAKNGWAVMAQPGYSWIDKRFLHSYEQFLPDEMLARLKFKTYIEKGVLICGSTDSPVQSLDPWQQMLGMTQFYNEEESISPYEAFKCYTVNPARAILEDDERGQLLPGKRADFFTGDVDIFSLSPEELAAFRPSKTYYLGAEAKPHSGTVFSLVKMLLGKSKKV